MGVEVGGEVTLPTPSTVPRPTLTPFCGAEVSTTATAMAVTIATPSVTKPRVRRDGLETMLLAAVKSAGLGCAVVD